MKYVIGFIVAIVAASVNAENVPYSGQLAQSCTFSGVTPGQLVFQNGNEFATQAIASFNVVNNDTFDVIIDTLDTFDSAPAGASMAAPATVTVETGGDNPNLPLSGAPGTGYAMTLAALGDTSVNMSISGTIANARAGDYQASVLISCLPSGF